MVYADEKYYTEKYLLGRKPVISSGFPFYARQASQVIDQHTFGRLKYVQDVPELVKMCCCELAEEEFRREKQQRDSGGKTAEKIGTYSVSLERRVIWLRHHDWACGISSKSGWRIPGCVIRGWIDVYQFGCDTVPVQQGRVDGEIHP